MPLRFAIDVNATVQDTDDGPELRLSWFHVPSAVSGETVDRLAGDLTDALAALVRHAAGDGAGGYTPSDLELVDVEQSDIDELEDLFADLGDDDPEDDR